MFCEWKNFEIFDLLLQSGKNRDVIYIVYKH